MVESLLMNPIDQLAEYFKEFPGVGVRQSKRFAYFLMTKNEAYLSGLSKAISEIKKNISECVSCHRLYPANGNALCDYCKNPARDASVLMVIEKDADFETVNRSKIYNGRYFILGGLVPIVEKNTREMIRLDELLQRISDDVTNSGLQEVILALSLNPQGEHTDLFLRERLRSLQEKFNFKISSLGRGLSTGTELEYSDNDTIKNALKNRQ